MTEKEALRRALRQRRDALPDRAGKSLAIRRAVEALPLFREARQLLCYVSVGSEPDTRPLLREALAQGREVYAPVCLPGRRLAFYRVARWEDLRPAAFGLLEPDPGAAPRWSPKGTAVCLVPGLAFDRRGFRLGYGGGYYDRFLEEWPLPTVGLCFEESLLPALPAEAHDRPVGAVATQRGVFPSEEADLERERRWTP